MESVDAMTKYETISTVLSIIAIVLTILIPLSQWVWKKWIMTAKVKYYPTGQATLFFNQSGSYIRINGVLEAERSAATIKKMSVALTRKQDERKLIRFSGRRQIQFISQVIAYRKFKYIEQCFRKRDEE